MIFSKEFLKNLQEQSEKTSILDFLMVHYMMNFEEAILEIAQYLQMQPESYEFKEKPMKSSKTRNKDEKFREELISFVKKFNEENA